MNRNNRRVPPEKRKRTETSCDKCKSRKQKCDRLLGQAQCRYCEIHNLICTTTQPRKTRVHENVEGVGSRVALLESLVKGLLPGADLSSNTKMLQLGKSLGIPLLAVKENCNDLEKDKDNAKEEDDNAVPLISDQQGQVQYIGPASSFQFHLTLRRVIGSPHSVEFAMFGRNAADPYGASAIPALFEDTGCRSGQLLRAISLHELASPSDAVKEIDGQVLDGLIDAYFDVVHSDFPVLHEASFRESYSVWAASTSAPDPAWFCGLFCVLILARRIAPFDIPEAIEKKWWRHAQSILPTMLFTSNIFAIQALLLAALHLHNTNHRDACWNLTGTAVRIGFAIGLHRDDVKNTQSPLQRELRKQLWWTLYTFEQMQVSSYDRPSAIVNAMSSVGCPNERIVGVAGHCSQDLLKWSQQLALLLGSACRTRDPTSNATEYDAYSQFPSPVAGILKELDRWKETLPAHLSLSVADSLAPSSQRPLYLIHVQYYYIIILVCRSALLRRATLLSKNGNESLPQPIVTISDICIEAGRALAQIVYKLETINKFNSCTWWDTFWTVASALVLVLNIFCSAKQQTPGSDSAEESRLLLRDLATLMARHLNNPRMPGSMQKFGQIIVDMNALADQFGPDDPPDSQYYHSLTSPQTPSLIPLPDKQIPPVAPPLPQMRQTPPLESNYSPPRQEIRQSTATFSKNSQFAEANASEFWAQLSFMQDPSGQMQDWEWDDVGALLRGDIFTQ